MEVRSGVNEDKNVEKLMDEHLRKNRLYRKKIAKDGSCLFRAVAEQVLLRQGLHTKVRAECVKYLREKRDVYESFIEGDFEEYLLRLQDPQSWVGQVEISALSVLYKRDFIIYQQPGEEPVNITQNGFADQVLLCFLNGNHYDSVYPISHAKSAAVCQSILYELLYERVCGVERKTLAPSLREHKSRDEFVEVNQRESSEESDLDEGDLWSSRSAGANRSSYRGRGRGQTRGGGRGRFLHKVQQSLSPGNFRNVEYDVWLRSKKVQQRRDFCMAAGMHYQTGDKCQVRLNDTGRCYSAHIQDVRPDDGPVTVFIEELGETRTVPLWNLRTPSEDSWSETSKRRSSSTSNGHTDERETKSGRKSGTRLEQQHSWPPQDSKELQSLGRNIDRRVDPDVTASCLTPAEKEELDLLDLLHKDEENFPSLEASTQAASGEGGKRAEKKVARSKSDKESKGPSQTSVPKEDPVKQWSSEDQDSQRIPNSSSSASLPAVSTTRGTKSAPAPMPATSQATQSPPKTVSTRIPYTKPQTAPASSTSSTRVAPSSQTAPDRSAKTPGATSATTPVSSQNSPIRSQILPKSKPVSSGPPVLPPDHSQTPQSQMSGAPDALVTAQLTTTTPVPNPTAAPPLPSFQTSKTDSGHPEPSSGVPQPAPVTIPPPAFPSTTKTSLGHPEPSPGVPQPAPVTTPAPAFPTTPTSKTSLGHLEPSSGVFQPAPVTTPSAAQSVPSAHGSSVPPASPGAPTPAQIPPSHLPLQQESGTYPPYPPLYPGNLNPMPIPQLPLSASTPPFCPPTESHPYDPAASGFQGPAGASMSSFQPQHPFTLAQISQDTLYPGVPKNDQGEFVQPPPFSLDLTGKDLPSDTSVLRFFFNLGVKAFIYPTLQPYTYLMPLTHAYHMQTSGLGTFSRCQGPDFPSPAPSSSPSNTPSDQFGTRGVIAAPLPPPVEAFNHHAIPGQMPMNAPFSSVYTGGMCLAPPAGHPVQYPSAANSVGLPLPPPEHGGMIGGAPIQMAGMILPGANKGPGLTWLPNGTRPEPGSVSFGMPSVMDEWEPERTEFTDVDPTRGPSNFNQNRAGRYGQEHRGNNKWRGSHSRRDYSGQGGQTFYLRGSSGRSRVRGYTQHTNARMGFPGVPFPPTANS